MSERVSASRRAYGSSAHAAIIHHRLFTASIGRPRGVKYVAAFQVLKGATLMCTALLLHWRPDAVAGERSFLYPLLFIATRGNTSVIDGTMRGSNLLPGLLFALGFYLAIVGNGLWQLRKWARRTVMVTCAVTLLLWLRTKVDFGFFGLTGSHTATPDLQNFHILLVLDGLVFLYLVRTNIGRRFRAI